MKAGNSSSFIECRFCERPLQYTFLDLGTTPLSNAYLRRDDLQRMEPFYPLHAYVCESCYLVQLGQSLSPEQIFSDYAYFSSYSPSWLEHARTYVDYVTDRFCISSASKVIEVASNDGYLLQYFNKRNVPVLGIEPAENVARVAQAAGILTLIKFFGVETAKGVAATHGQADLLLGNNVLAHVPKLNDFVKGLKIVLKPQGVITMEFPHLMRLMAENQFDTIYHEHFFYFSFLTVEKVFAKHDLVLFDVEELPTHGGSLRIFARHKIDDSKNITANVLELRERELQNHFNKIEAYAEFSTQVQETKYQLLEFLIKLRRSRKQIVGYGAPAKGNTLLNYCGIRTDFIDYTVDISPHKQGRFLPGSHIPIYPVEKIKDTKPDYVLILPWNLKNEIIGQMGFIRDWGGKFIVPIPKVSIQ